jgi:hypothetical protein
LNLIFNDILYIKEKIMSYRRTNPVKANDMETSISFSYNELAGALKHIIAGPKLVSVGAIDTATFIGKGLQVALWATVAGETVTMSDDVTSLTSSALGSGGIPLKANDYTYLALGDDSAIIASSANVFCFIMADDTIIRDYNP